MVDHERIGGDLVHVIEGTELTDGAEWGELPAECSIECGAASRLSK